MNTERYRTESAEAQSGKVAFVVDDLRHERISCYSKRAYGVSFRRRAQDEADSLNASDMRIADNAAVDSYLPYPASQEFQRDMED